jgi:hypothetical protein
VIAVQSFLDQIANNGILWPKLKIAGVLGAMTNYNIGSLTEDPADRSKFTGAEPAAIQLLEDSLEAFRDSGKWATPRDIILPYTTFVPRKFDIGRASGEGLAYINGTADVKAVFDRLGQEVATRIGLNLE